MKKDASESVELTREELYQQVWKTPMVRLAKEFGISGRGLAKICERFSIPRPPRGYWAKLQNGKRVWRPPLEPLKEARTVQFVIRKRLEQTYSRPMTEKPIVPPVPEEEVEPHPLVARTAKSLRSAKPSEQGLVSPRAKRALRVSVAPASIDRAKWILDALVKALEEDGSTIETEKDEEDNPRTAAVVEGERIEFRLSEKLDRSEREPTPKEARERKKWYWLASKPLYRYTPTGKLSLEILTWGDQRIIRRWSDLKRTPLEKRLGSFVTTLNTISCAIKRRRREREEERRRWEAHRKERDEKRALIEEEQDRLKKLEEEVDAWHRSQRIREYLEAVSRAATTEVIQLAGASDLETWLAWAILQADRLDPLKESPQSILDEKAKWCGWRRW